MTALAGRLTAAEEDYLIQCEETISNGLTAFMEVGNALTAVRDNRLYRAEFGTFEEYCARRWGFTDSRARQLILAAATVTTVTVDGLPAPANEAQARELARIPEADRAEVWRGTIEATDGKPTAAAIRAAANPDRPSATGEADARLDTAVPAAVSEAPTGAPAPVGAGETADGSLGAPSDASDTEPAWTPGVDAAPDSDGQKTSESGVTPDPLDDPAALAEQHRERSSAAVAEALVAIRMRLEPDPIRWLRETWKPGGYRFRDMPRVRDSFTPEGLRQSAKYLQMLADHLDQNGETL